MRDARASAAALVLAALFAASSARAGDVGASRDPDRVHLERLDSLFGTDGALPPERGLDPKSRGERYRALVRSRLEQDRFYETVLPRYFTLLSPPPAPDNPFMAFTLRRGETNGREFYYLFSPCAARDQVKVEPWWDLGTQIWVCKDAYRPDIEADTRSGSRQNCEATNYRHPDGPLCRCIQHLLNCARDEQQRDELERSYSQEPLRTMAHVVRSGQPFSRALSMNESVRNDWGELYYARSRYFRTGRLELAKPGPSEAFRLRSRESAYTGGVLTTPVYLHFDDARRIVIATLWEDFLCTPLTSTSVRAREMFHIASASLRQKQHLELTTMNGCKDCHARLEYGMLAFTRFTNTRDGFRLLDESGDLLNTRVYVRSSSDLRGEGPSTPLWLGEMIAAQPEFLSCMVRKTEQLVFQGLPVPDEVDRVLLARFAVGQDLGALIADTVVGRYVGAAGLTSPLGAR